ncbi:MAG: UDP-N-acetylglucosamine 2-epimerase (non-hydrolyzing) [Bacteroidetes bacterium]|nr:MAG: UDP-N-acetylglucosamine 2-epimerase (non-hydrolyzing) [Bacteroidota bacterium]
MKILTIIGARPQFVKASVLSRAFSAYSDIEEYIVHTGQHYDDNMSAVFFKELGLRQADQNLNIQGGSNASMVAQMILAIESIIRQQDPDLVLVYGDTNSTLAGGVTAKMCGKKLAHVEAGMRHGDLSISEELNRVLTDNVSDYLFCSTEAAMNNLLAEGAEKKSAQSFLCGDLMMDAALHYSKIAESRPILLDNNVRKNYILCTLHRAENVDNEERLINLFSALDKIAEHTPVILPIHPRTRKRMSEFGLRTAVTLMDPVGYLDILNLIRHSSLIMTDSGGLQKEAYCFKKHTVLLREHTEWVELLDNGYLITAGTDPLRILNAFNELRNKQSSFEENFYGRGDAGENIAGVISKLSIGANVSLRES